MFLGLQRVVTIGLGVAAGLLTYDLLKDAADFADRILKAVWRRIRGA